MRLLQQDPLGGQMRSTDMLYPFSVGYVIYDTVDLFRTYASKARSSPPQWILIHHLALLSGGAFSCLATGFSGKAWPSRPSECTAQPLIMLLYTNEFNSLFMLSRVLLRLLGFRISGSDLGTRFYRANLAMFALTFCWVRAPLNYMQPSVRA